MIGWATKNTRLNNRLLRLLSLLVFLSLIAFMASNIYSIHTHVLPDGRVIVHSHPVGHDDGEESQDHHHHSHTEKEYIIYGIYSHALDKAILFLNVILIIFVAAISISFLAEKINLSQNVHVDHSSRAPPLLLW
jgi:hypothetical protein